MIYTTDTLQFQRLGMLCLPSTSLSNRISYGQRGGIL